MQRQKEINIRLGLVIGCGRSCKDHSEERWFSINDSTEKNPETVVKNLKNLDNCHFKDNGNFIIKADGKKEVTLFKAILLKNLDSSNRRPPIKKLKELLDHGGSLMLFNSSFPQDWEEFSNAQLKIDTFFFYDNKMILVTTGGSLTDAFEKILNYLSENLKATSEGKQFLNFMKLYEDEFNELSKNYAFIPPILRSLLAHLTSYVADRKNRVLRNPTEDENYEKFKKEMIGAVSDYATSIINAQQLKNKLSEWRRKKPSSWIPSRYFTYANMAYCKLEKFIDNSLLALDYYVKNYEAPKADNASEENQKDDERYGEIVNFKFGL